MGQTKELMYETMRRGHATRKEYVCGECLQDKGLSDFVIDNALSKQCDFCGSTHEDPHAASLGDVIERMAECIAEEYNDPANELPYETREGGWQGEVFDAWELLEDIGFHADSEGLFEKVVEAFSDQQWCRRDYFSLSPTDRLRYGWDAFKKAVKHTRRFTFWSMEDDSGESEFHPDYMPVGKMLAIIGDCIRDTELVKAMPKGTPIWRVRIHGADVVPQEDHELSPPPVELARQANRMSPAGIVMFYGAEDYETACAETLNPNRADGKRVTGAAFRTAREMRLLDLVDLPSIPSFFQLGSADYRHTLVFLRHFARDLAIPVARDGREHVEYVPTQAFTEYVRHELRLHDDTVIDGIRYRSAVNDKPCVVLFCTQDHCIAAPRGYAECERWLECDVSTLCTEDAQLVARRVRSGGIAKEGA
jgi:hypothetical protein